MPDERSPLAGPLSRRKLLSGLGLAGAGAALGGATIASGIGPFAAPVANADADSAANRTYPFYGEHQAGIVTPAQDRLAFAAMNVLDGTSRSDLRVLLQDWTVAAERMTQRPARRATTPTWTTRRSTPARPSARPSAGSRSPSGTVRRSSTIASGWRRASPRC